MSKQRYHIDFTIYFVNNIYYPMFIVDSTAPFD